MKTGKRMLSSGSCTREMSPEVSNYLEFASKTSVEWELFCLFYSLHFIFFENIRNKISVKSDLHTVGVDNFMAIFPGFFKSPKMEIGQKNSFPTFYVAHLPARRIHQRKVNCSKPPGEKCPEYFIGVIPRGHCGLF